MPDPSLETPGPIPTNKQFELAAQFKNTLAQAAEDLNSSNVSVLTEQELEKLTQAAAPKVDPDEDSVNRLLNTIAPVHEISEFTKVIIYGNQGTSKTTLSMHAPRPLLIAIEAGSKSLLNHESDNLPREWFDILGSVLLNRELIFLNAKFDIAALSTIGFDALQCPRIWDIATMAHMVNEEFPSKALDWLSKFILKDQKDSDKVLNWAKFFGWHSIPVQLMDPYASKDAELTLRLFDILYREMI